MYHLRPYGTCWGEKLHSNIKHDGPVTERTVGADNPADHIYN